MRSQRWRMGVILKEGEEAARGEPVYTCGYLCTSPRLCFDTRKGRKRTSSIIRRPRSTKKAVTWGEPTLAFRCWRLYSGMPADARHIVPSMHSFKEMGRILSDKKVTPRRFHLSSGGWEGWPALLVMCGILTAQPVLVEGDHFNNETAELKQHL